MTAEYEARQKSALTLAFLGDAVYDLLVREYLTEHCDALPGLLHKLTVAVVNAAAQSEALKLLTDYLTIEETNLVKRGKNSSKAAIPQNATAEDYRAATALEALFGYLSLTGQQERMNELFTVISRNQIDKNIDMIKSGISDIGEIRNVSNGKGLESETSET